jgi:hypothetical protein
MRTCFIVLLLIQSSPLLATELRRRTNKGSLEGWSWNAAHY